MQRLRWSGVAVLVGLVSVMTQACSSDDDDDGGLQNEPRARVRVVADPPRIANNGESTTLTLTATNADGSTGEGTVELTAAAGAVTPSSVVLDAEGKAEATFTCNVADDSKCTGQVLVTANWGDVKGTGVVTVEGDAGPGTDPEPDDGGVTTVGPPTSITWVSTKCRGQDCTLMGIKNSGFNEQAQITFQVQDTNNLPVRGVNVTFSLVNPPTGTALQSTTGVTNSNGVVVARVVSGLVIGAFAVKADVADPALSTVSPTIGVRGAKPSNRAFTFQCARINIPAWTTAQPPALIEVECSVGLADRYNNPVGTGTSVFFKTEAGAITNDVATEAFSASGDNTGEGVGVVTYRTGPGGSFPPVDVEPFGAVTQWPMNRADEPSHQVGGYLRNPRDQLVTMLAYVQGEEHFDDNNANGEKDANEPFVDQAEPFVDSNDNNTWDPGEVFIDSNKNNVWDDANGVWDADTTIWTERRMLLTGYLSADPDASFVVTNPAHAVDPVANRITTFSAFCPGGIVRGGELFLYPVLRDDWLNHPTGSSTVTVAHSATKGGVSVVGSATLLDDYGFDYNRVLVDDDDEGPCSPDATVSPICRWKTVFGGWVDTQTHVIRIAGAGLTDTTACQNDRVSVGMTVNQVNNWVEINGAIQ